MSSSEGWTKNKRGRDARTPAADRTRARSLKDALSEAGLGEAERAERGNSASLLADALAADPTPLMTPRLALFGEPDVAQETTAQRIAPVSVSRPPSSVVSPAPWQRAASRGRRRSLLANTFGWAMTLVVAGSIIGVAGRYLLLSPPGLQHVQAARQ
jgi:hypothetical protein